MNEFEKKALNTIKKHNMIQSGDRIVVGLSGGADSSTLLSLLVNLKKELNFSVIAAHLNHGIRGSEAQRDLEFSKSLAERYGVDFVSETVCVPQYAKEKKLSEEMAGRELRYEFFNKICKEYKCNKIAVAHNKNDRAETIILNLIRGSGANGMEGIKAVNGNVIRPLIDTLRSEIENYSKLQNISYMTDSSNNEDVYARNIVRNKILTQMTRINSNAISNIIKCSEIISDESEYMNEQIKSSDICIFTDEEAYIDKKRFELLHISLRRRIILYCVKQICNSTKNITSKQIEQAASNVKTGKHTSLGNGFFAINNSTQIVITNAPPRYLEYEYIITIPSVIQVKETGLTYSFEYADSYIKDERAVFLSLDEVDLNSLVLRTKVDGDCFTPSGMCGKKKLKKFFIDAKIPSEKRYLYPIVADKNNIIAVLPLRVNEKNIITEKTSKILKIKIMGGTYD